MSVVHREASGSPRRTNQAQDRLLAHSAIRLTCTMPATRRCGGSSWARRGGRRARLSPGRAVGGHARWLVRAAIDAVVWPRRYGLTRDQYAHVLSTFSHSSYKDAPRLCLAAFDELQSLGLEAFTQKHDPYWDIPLNENLPSR